MKLIEKWDERMIDLARHFSTWSKDPSTQTGAVIVSPDRTTILPGYNGFAKGAPDDPEIYADREVKYERILHCEMNAVLLGAQSVKGFTLYTYPFLSCPRCAVHMIQCGIARCVAPAIPPDKMERWGEAMERTKQRFTEVGVKWTELNLEDGHVSDEYTARARVTDEQRRMLNHR